MIWVLNGTSLCNGLELRKKKQKISCNPEENGAFLDYDYRGRVNSFCKHTGKEIITFRWKHPPKSWWFSNKQIYIDLANLYGDNKNNLFLIKKIYKKIPCGGWGEIISKEDFLNGFKDGIRY
jgi:hypothetical protein